jgi:glycosyltransferase involved in cell wall biosynthesis
MDLFALSSDTEQMPVCLLEAMGSCLAVAATDVGDVRTVLPAGQEPFLVPLSQEAPEEATAAALAAALDRLARDPEERRRLGRINRRRVEERFSFAAMLSAYRDVYQGVLCAPPSPLPPVEAVEELC